MSVYELNSRHLREVLILCFNIKKSAAEAHRMLSNTYGEAATSERTCRECFQRFKNGDFNVEDWYSGGREKIIEDAELEALFKQDFVSKSRRIGTIIGSDSTSYFKTSQSHENDSEARKLGAVRSREMLNGICLFVNSCLKGKDGRNFCIVL